MMKTRVSVLALALVSSVFAADRSLTDATGRNPLGHVPDETGTHIASSSRLPLALDMRAAAVRPVASVPDELFSLAYNSGASGEEPWPAGGVPGKTVTICLTVMDAHGERGNPVAWTPLPLATVLVCQDGEGILAWKPMSRSFVRAELVDGVSVLATAYFDFSECADLRDLPVAAVSEPVDVALDTRPFFPRRTPETFGEVLPLVYMADWFEGSDEGVTGLNRITVTPVGGGSDETFILTNFAGTVAWTPTAARAYLVTLTCLTEDGEIVADEVVVDLSEAADVEVNDIRDDAETVGSVRIPRDWLRKHDIDPDLATNKAQVAENGLPVWKNYVFGLDPNKPNLAFAAAIEPLKGEDGRFAVSGSVVSEQVRTELVGVWYRLLSANDPGAAFEKDPDAADTEGRPDFTVRKTDRSRFFRIRALFYWKR